MEHQEAPNPKMHDEQVSVQLIRALSRAWSKIQSLHGDVPSVVLLPAPALGGRLNVLGHFAALRWQGRRDRNLHEVVVIAEHLNRRAEDVMETLLHEAAHAMNFERGIRDCTASQYHNRSFAKAARELGLDVSQVRNYGFAETSLPDSTATIYREEIEHLKEVLVHRHRSVTLPVGPGSAPQGDDQEDDRPSSRSRKATCACPFIIRVSKKTIDETTIRCDTCGEPFRLT